MNSNNVNMGLLGGLNQMLIGGHGLKSNIDYVTVRVLPIFMFIVGSVMTVMVFYSRQLGCVFSPEKAHHKEVAERGAFLNGVYTAKHLITLPYHNVTHEPLQDSYKDTYTTNNPYAALAPFFMAIALYVLNRLWIQALNYLDYDAPLEEAASIRIYSAQSHSQDNVKNGEEDETLHDRQLTKHYERVGRALEIRSDVKTPPHILGVELPFISSLLAGREIIVAYVLWQASVLLCLHVMISLISTHVLKEDLIDWVAQRTPSNTPGPKYIDVNFPIDVLHDYFIRELTGDPKRPGNWYTTQCKSEYNYFLALGYYLIGWALIGCKYLAACNIGIFLISRLPCLAVQSVGRFLAHGKDTSALRKLKRELGSEAAEAIAVMETRHKKLTKGFISNHLMANGVFFLEMYRRALSYDSAALMCQSLYGSAKNSVIKAVMREQGLKRCASQDSVDESHSADTCKACLNKILRTGYVNSKCE